MLRQMIILGVVAGLPAFAQTAEKIERRTENRMVFSGVAGPGGLAHTIEFRSLSVKGAPYAAESVTETTQILADGNRIVNRQSGKEYRDSEGRTRHDSAVQPMGPWVAEGKSSSISVINDPVSGEHFTLNHDEKTAFKVSAAPLIHVSEGGKQVKREVQVGVRRDAAATSTTTVTTDTAPDTEVKVETLHQARPTRTSAVAAIATMPRQEDVVMWAQAGGGEGAGPKVEALGKRVIEGVECEGTKTVMTIDAGMIGNERPIEIVTERWSSPELKVDVMRKHSDPRFGETNYRLQGVVRGEQPRSLFEAPSDYKAGGLMGPGSEVRVFQRKTKE